MPMLFLRKTAVFVVSAVLLGLAGAAILGEAVVRVLDLPPKPLESLYVPKYRLSDNPILRFEYRPNYVPYEKNLPEFDRDWTTNSSGFRETEHPYDKPHGVTRIAILGDSTTAGNGIRYAKDVYVKKLQDLLNAKSDSSHRYEVFNMAVGGYNTLQEVEFLRVKGLAYHPDLVLIGFCVNDYDIFADGDLYRTLLKLNTHLDHKHPPPTVWRAILKYSRLAFFIYHRSRALEPQAEVIAEYQNDILHGQDTVQAGLQQLASLQKEYGFKAMIFILPAFDTPFSRYQYRDIHEKLKVEAKLYAQIPVVDLLPDFQALSDDPGPFKQDNVHPNLYGNQVIAEILERILRKQKMI